MRKRFFDIPLSPLKRGNAHLNREFLMATFWRMKAPNPETHCYCAYYAGLPNSGSGSSERNR